MAIAEWHETKIAASLVVESPEDVITAVSADGSLDTPGKGGHLCNIHVSGKVSVRWLADQAQRGLDVSEFADTGAYERFKVRWVLVDAQAEKEWASLPRRDQRRLRAIVQTDDGPKFSTSDRDRLVDIGIHDGIVFHLFAIEDEEYSPSAACESRTW